MSSVQTQISTRNWVHFISQSSVGKLKWTRVLSQLGVLHLWTDFPQKRVVCGNSLLNWLCINRSWSRSCIGWEGKTCKQIIWFFKAILTNSLKQLGLIFNCLSLYDGILTIQMTNLWGLEGPWRTCWNCRTKLRPKSKGVVLILLKDK